MYRSAIKQMMEWKKDPFRKPLLLLGARQVGKTWLMNEFGEKCYKNAVFVRFDQNPQMKGIFERDYDLKRILTALQIQAGFPIEPEHTLIIFDEIQTCPAALTSLKYFCEEAPQYHIVAAGSLLGIADQPGTGFPVGKVDRIYLHPMNFPEFLAASGNQPLLDLLENRDWSMVESFQNNFEDLLRYYYFVGGMPEAVSVFVASRDFQRVRKVHLALLADYRDDFGKHAPGELRSLIEMLWDSIPAQLAKENKKFFFSKVYPVKRSRELEPAMRWLVDAGLISLVKRVSKPAAPLSAYCDGAFKAFFLDVGLLGAQADLNPRIILDGNRVFQEFKGALTEQYVMQQLLAEYSRPPYYWSSGSGTSEIDFLLEHQGNIIPIEAKAERNLQAKSLKFYCQKFRPELAVRTSMSHYYLQQVAIPSAKDGVPDGHYTLMDIPLYGIHQFGK